MKWESNQTFKEMYVSPRFSRALRPQCRGRTEESHKLRKTVREETHGEQEGQNFKVWVCLDMGKRDERGLRDDSEVSN